MSGFAQNRRAVFGNAFAGMAKRREVWGRGLVPRSPCLPQNRTLTVARAPWSVWVLPIKPV